VALNLEGEKRHKSSRIFLADGEGWRIGQPERARAKGGPDSRNMNINQEHDTNLDTKTIFLKFKEHS